MKITCNRCKHTFEAVPSSNLLCPQCHEKIVCETVIETSSSDVLELKNGKIVLPVKQMVLPHSVEITDIIKNTVPPDIWKTIKTTTSCENEKHTLLGKIIFSFLLIAILFGVFWAWPKAPEMAVTTGGIIDSTGGENITKQYEQISVQASKALAKDEYIECLKVLSMPLEEITRDSMMFKKNNKLMDMYLQAFTKADMPENYSEKTRKFLLDAMRYEQDNLIWKYDFLLVAWRPFEKGHCFIEYNIVAKQEKLLNNFLLLAKSIKARNLYQKNKQLCGQSVARLDLQICEILTAQWIVIGGNAGGIFKDDYPDDEKDPGVAEREEAYELALQYKNDTSFIQLRKFIAEKINNEILPWSINHYFFDGEKRYNRKYLKDVISQCNDALKEAKRQSSK